MRDDPRPRTQLPPQLRHQLLVDSRQKEERHHRRLADVRLEQILRQEPDAIDDAGRLRVVLGPAIELRVDLDADAERTVPLRRRDRDPAVARPQVVSDIGGSDVREPSTASTTCRARERSGRPAASSP